MVRTHKASTRIGPLSANTWLVPLAVTRMTQLPGVLSTNDDDDC